jgi:hypothetical protein
MNNKRKMKKKIIISDLKVDSNKEMNEVRRSIQDLDEKLN